MQNPNRNRDEARQQFINASLMVAGFFVLAAIFTGEWILIPFALLPPLLFSFMKLGPNGAEIGPLLRRDTTAVDATPIAPGSTVEEQMIARLTQDIARNPRDVRSYLARGQIFLRRWELEKALEDFDAVVAIDRRMKEAYTLRANVYYLMKNFEDALANANYAIRLDGRDYLPYVVRGANHLQDHNYDAAIADFKQATTLNPDYALAYINMGVAYQRLGNYDRALELFDKGESLEPDNAMVYINRGHTYAMMGNLDKALESADEGVKRASDVSFAYINRGQIYYLQGKLEDAQADFQKATALKPPSDTATVCLAIVQHEQGQSDAAVTGWRSFIDKDARYHDLNRVIKHLDLPDKMRPSLEGLAATTLPE